MKPTEEQIKEFWEWCGLVHIDNPISNEAANACEAMMIDRPVNGWYNPDYQKGTSKLISLRDAPIIDLNNLFAYALQKLGDGLQQIILQPDISEWYCGLTPSDKLYEAGNKDPALTLFWEIWEVLK